MARFVAFEQSEKRIGGVVRETSESDRLFTRGTRRVAEEIRQVSERRVKKRVKKNKERKNKKKGGKKRREKKSKAPVESARSVGIACWTEPLAYEPKCARSHARISRTVVVRGQAPPPHLSSSGLGRRAAHRVSSRAEPSRVGQYSGQRGGESTRPRSPRTRARRHSEAATTLSFSPLSSLLALRRRIRVVFPPIIRTRDLGCERGPEGTPAGRPAVRSILAVIYLAKRTLMIRARTQA